MNLAYPRLPRAVAADLLTELTGLDATELRLRSALQHPRADWYPTATARVTPRKLGELQAMIRSVAGDHGHPGARSRDPRLTAFDRALAPLLVEGMDLAPAEAAHEGMWSFLSLVVVPDVALWRFPNDTAAGDYERIIGRPRNVLRRLWWRAFILGDAGPELLEDEAVAILERPTLGGDRRLARAIARTHLDHAAGAPAGGRTELLRDAMKRLRRLGVPITLAALPDDELQRTIAAVFDQTAEAMSQRSATAETGP